MAGAILVAASLTGCIDLFRPAKPEPPPDTSGGGAADYGTPSDALSSMADGIHAKGSSGQAAYVGAFANPNTDGYAFTATFDPDVARNFVNQGGIVPTWTYDLEKNFYSGFVRISRDGYLMRWEIYQGHGGDEFDPASGDSTLHRRYSVITVDADGNSGPAIAVGIADLHFKRLAPNRWAIVRWEDNADGSLNANLSFSKRRLESLSQ